MSIRIPATSLRVQTRNDDRYVVFTDDGRIVFQPHDRAYVAGAQKAVDVAFSSSSKDGAHAGGTGT